MNAQYKLKSQEVNGKKSIRNKDNYRLITRNNCLSEIIMSVCTQFNADNERLKEEGKEQVRKQHREIVGEKSARP